MLVFSSLRVIQSPNNSYLLYVIFFHTQTYTFLRTILPSQFLSTYQVIQACLMYTPEYQFRPISVIKIRYLSLKRSHLVNGIIQDVPVARDIPCNSINHSIPSGKGWLRSRSKRIDSSSSFPRSGRPSDK